MRPNFFANTPDILHEHLQVGGRPPSILARAGGDAWRDYGIYSGFELHENVPVRLAQEHLDSESATRCASATGMRPQTCSSRPHRARERDPARVPGSCSRDWSLQALSTDNPHTLVTRNPRPTTEPSSRWSSAWIRGACSRLGCRRRSARSGLFLTAATLQ